MESMWANQTIGMGCMRLSTERERDEARAIEVLHAAFDAGVTFLDTADAYCLGDNETGHNERLIARARATWNGDSSRILVATKGGLTRPQGAWVADGRARHLIAACEASRCALGVERIDLYQLHAPDPRTPLSTSVRALASLKRDGLIERVGLCNVNVGQASSFKHQTSHVGRRDGEVVLIMGLPGAGKSTMARTYVEQGYERLNRDEVGGSLRGLLPALDLLIESGRSRIVLDNTYVSRKARGALMQAATKRGLSVRCVWLATSVEDAQMNAAWRMVETYGRLLGPHEMRVRSGAGAKPDATAFGPGVQFRYQRELEPPHASEGFSRIETIPFERMHDPSFTNRALIIWCDGVLSRSVSGQRVPVSPDDVEVFPERGEVLRRYAADGWRLLGLGWQPEIAEEVLTADRAEAGYARMQERLGVAMDVLYCPHGGGPPICWCRKPLPGLGVVFIERYRLDPSRCLYVGAGPQDPGFARRLGFQYRDATGFFSLDHSSRNRSS